MASGRLALGTEKNPVRKPYRRVLVLLFNVVTYNLDLTARGSGPLVG